MLVALPGLGGRGGSGAGVGRECAKGSENRSLARGGGLVMTNLKGRLMAQLKLRPFEDKSEWGGLTA